MNLKIPDTSFCLFPFSNIKKRMLINLAQFLLILFLNTKKAYLRISKYQAQFFAYSPFQILKKNTYKS